MIKTPTYWAERGWRAVLLLPLSVLWAIGSLVRDSLARPARATVPVVCIQILGGHVSTGGDPPAQRRDGLNRIVINGRARRRHVLVSC